MEKGFWEMRDAVLISKEIADLKEEIKEYEILEKEVQESEELFMLSENDEVLLGDIEKKVDDLKRQIGKEEIRTFLSGKYDKGSAILSVYSGAGGQDAQDWSAMLLRMYLRYCDEKKFKVKILNESFGEAGIKQASLKIDGKYAFGYLKRENGVHRLVRISPFSAQKLRHTSFALIEVLPEIPDKEGIAVRLEDLKIDFYHASGPGGQYVNKRETAVRITHLPTKIQVSCQSERLQGKNREIAMKVLLSKLYSLREKEKEKEASKLKGKPVLIEWGSQIRSYVLHPYKMVKDLRTGVETSKTEEVLSGSLDQFIEAEIKLLKND